MNKRPLSLRIISWLCLNIAALFWLLGLMFLIFNEEYRTGIVESFKIPFPGWESIYFVLSGKSETAGDPLETIQAVLWVTKINYIITMFIMFPLIIGGWLGVYRGRCWGRKLLYVFIGLSISGKIISMPFLGEGDGSIFKFLALVIIFIILIVLLRSPSWRRWIEKETSHGD